jgi:hypothetical protein
MQLSLKRSGLLNNSQNGDHYKHPLSTSNLIMSNTKPSRGFRAGFEEILAEVSSEESDEYQPTNDVTPVEGNNTSGLSNTFVPIFGDSDLKEMAKTIQTV